MIDRIKGKVSAKETPVGFMPNIADLNLSGLEISKEIMKKLFEINRDEWSKEVEGIEQFYAQFGTRLPEFLKKHLEKLKKGL
jgi:phosphoenolpyruvate carboxykinase (GTP)